MRSRLRGNSRLFAALLLVATVVVVVGLLVATFLRGVVATSADRVGLSYAQHLANGCYYVFALLTFIAAFHQLGIEFALLEQLILIAFGAVAVGFGLSFGLVDNKVCAVTEVWSGLRFVIRLKDR